MPHGKWKRFFKKDNACRRNECLYHSHQACFSNSLLFLLNAVYSGQWKLSFGTPPFRGHKILSRKNVHIIYVSNASIEGTPLFTGKGHYFNLRLAARAKMSLSRAQNIFIPANTINTWWLIPKETVNFVSRGGAGPGLLFLLALTPSFIASSPLACMVYTWSILSFEKENERLPAAYTA